jgi:hypothetical protein
MTLVYELSVQGKEFHTVFSGGYALLTITDFYDTAGAKRR